MSSRTRNVASPRSSGIAPRIWSGSATAIGVEPTGNPFHAIVLERGTNRPMNPLVNAGAIAIAGLLPGKDPTERLNRGLDAVAVHIGSRPAVDMGVFMSERTTADRPRLSRLHMLCLVSLPSVQFIRRT